MAKYNLDGTDITVEAFQYTGDDSHLLRLQSYLESQNVQANMVDAANWFVERGGIRIGDFLVLRDATEPTMELTVISQYIMASRYTREGYYASEGFTFDGGSLRMFRLGNDLLYPYDGTVISALAIANVGMKLNRRGSFSVLTSDTDGTSHLVKDAEVVPVGSYALCPNELAPYLLMTSGRMTSFINFSLNRMLINP